MKLASRTLVRNLVAVAVIAAVTACSPAPRRTLTSEEKVADMYWLYSQFGQNYAPMKMKEQLHGFKADELKARYLELAKATASNEEFYQVMHRFVAEFRDAHTSSTLLGSQLPGRTHIAYLGVTGVRKGNGLLVTGLLPTIAKGGTYPVKVGDVVTKFDGVDLPTVVKTTMVKSRNLGQDESNLTYHMPRIFNRYSLAHEMPASADAVLTLTRNGAEMNVTVPWIRKDMMTFAEEQAKAAQKSTVKVANLDEGLYFHVGLMALNGHMNVIPTEVNRINPRAKGFNPLETFQFMDDAPLWDSRMLTQAVGASVNAIEAARDEMVRVRNVPSNVLWVNEAKTYPTYIANYKLLDKDGKDTGKTKAIATMYLNTFSPGGAQASTVLAEVSATLQVLQSFGVKDLVIDMINNGGGSLELGLKLGQLLSNEKLLMPEIEFKISETWMDEFEGGSLEGGNDAEKEHYRRVYTDLKRAADAGQLLSSRWSTEALYPYSIQPNTNLTSKLNVVLLVNEMCASMCDIFTAMMKDNGLVTVVGSKTMGAGGNVVNHYEAPNSHIQVRQTESLVLRKDGSYVENGGIEPDVAMAVNESANDKYAPVHAKAVELLTKESAAAATTETAPAPAPAPEKAEKTKSGGVKGIYKKRG